MSETARELEQLSRAFDGVNVRSLGPEEICKLLCDNKGAIEAVVAVLRFLKLEKIADVLEGVFEAALMLCEGLGYGCKS